VAGGHTAVSEASGAYTITGLPAGAYTVTPTSDRFVFDPLSTDVTVGPSVTDINFVGDPRYRIGGTVMSGGAPLAGVTIDAGGGRTTVTGIDGAYTIGGLVAGDYTLTASKPEFTFVPAALSVTVGPDATGQDFEAAPVTYSVSGTVTAGGAPLAGVTIDAGGGHTAVTAGDGTYTIVALVAGEYTLTASRPEYTFAPDSRNVAVGPDATGQDFEGAPVTYGISGTVTAGGAPLAGVTIDAGGGHTAVTAGDGAYTIAGLVAGEYTLTASKPEFTFAPSALVVTVGPDATGRDFEAAPVTYSVSGTVTASGAPLAGVTIDAGNGHTAVTAADGTYTLAGLVAGTYTLTPSRAEYGFTPGARDVVVGPDAAGQDFEASQDTYSIGGTVAADGAPLAGVSVDAGGGHTAVTGPDGGYTITGLVAGTYTLTASKAEYAFTPATLSVTVGPSASGQDFAAVRVIFSISGTVSAGGLPLAGVTVDAGGGRAAVTGADGTYTIADLAAGEYTLTASLAEYTFAPAALEVTLGPSAAGKDFAATQVTYSIGGAATVGGTPLAGVTVDAGGGRTTVTGADGTYTIAGLVAGEYTLTAGLAEYTFAPAALKVTVGPSAAGKDFAATQVTYSIGGTATVSGAPLAGVTVDAGGGHTAVTGADGTYTIAGLVAGTYTLTASKAEYTLAPATLSVTVGPSASEEDFTATQVTYSIGGTATVGGAPLAGVTVDAGGGRTAVTGADGTYTIVGLVAGEYTLTASLAEYTFAPATLSVTVGPSASEEDFAATQVTYSISGTATVGGAPLAGVTVDAGGGRTAVTGADGTYTIGGLVAGTYTLTASKAEYAFAPATLSVTVGPGASGQDFAATQVTYSISGTVTVGGAPLAGVTVDAGGGHTAVTGADGTYTIAGLVAGSYTLAASLAEYTFAPATLSVTVGPSATGHDFVASRVYSKAFAAGWVLFSVPASSGDATAGELFGDAGQSAAWWDTGTNSYAPLAGPPVLGRGYWFHVGPGGHTVQAAGEPASGSAVEVALGTGWQMAGNPFEEAIDWSTTTVRVSGGAEVPLAQATAVTPYAWAFDSEAQSFVLVDPRVPGAETMVAPWSGFFVYAHSPVTLVLHRPGALAANRTTVPLLRADSGGFTLNLSARCGASADRVNVLGVRPRGASGDLRVADPPPVSSDLSLTLIPPQTSGGYAVDMREGDRTAAQWTYDAMVRSTAANRQVVLSWGDLRSLPREYEAVLTDVDAGESICLRTAGAYTFETGQGGAERRFRITIGRSTGGLRIVAARADALRSGGVAVAYSLTAPATVSARVLNAAGRVVAQPLQGEVQASGAQTLSWTGRGLTGSSVPPGQYVIELEATGEAAARARAAVRVTIGR